MEREGVAGEGGPCPERQLTVGENNPEEAKRDGNVRYHLWIIGNRKAWTKFRESNGRRNVTDAQTRLAKEVGIGKSKKKNKK